MSGAAASFDPRRSRWIPWAIVASFLVVIAVNGALIYFATSSWTGVVTETPFEDGNDYNRVLARGDAEAATGWTVTIDAARPAAGSKQAHIVVVVVGLAPNVKLVARAVAQRPIGRNMAMNVPLAATAPGRFEGDAVMASPGNWELRVVLESDTATLHATHRVMLP